MKKSELNTIITETIYELLKEGDETLIKLMMEKENLYGTTDDQHIDEWVERTTSVIEESLNIDPELDETEMLTEGHIEMLRLAGVLEEDGGADKDAAWELTLYIDNDAQLHKSQYMPILKNLSKKFAAGKYDKKLAVKLWMYLVEAGAKKYFKENGGMGKWMHMFNVATRLVVADELEKSNRDVIENGDYL